MNPPSERDSAARIAAWGDATAALLAPNSSLRATIRERGGDRDARLSPAGLQAGLECLVRGVRREVFEVLAAEAGVEPNGDELVILAGNLPALFLQPLARALAARRRVLLKPASQNPHFVEAFVDDLVARLPDLQESVRTRRWQGGDRVVEDELFATVDRLVVYGDRAAVESVVSRRREAGRSTIVHGPKTSLAIAGSEADPETWATKLGTDVALFDQRGCLSVSAVWVPDERLGEWVSTLADGLARQARLLPPGPATPGEAAAVHAVRIEAVMRGVIVRPVGGELTHGTVLAGSFVESWPVLRTLQVVPYGSLAEVHAALAGQRGRIQGLALTPDLVAADDLARACGASRVAPFGDLQEADATWDDGETV